MFLRAYFPLARKRARSEQFHASDPDLSRVNCVNFEPIEIAVPSVGEVEDRHVEHQHRIVPSTAPLEYFSPAARETLL
jgi:hypothetical protein